MHVGRILQGIVMDDGILTIWPKAGDLSTQLQALPAVVHMLGFEHFAFVFNGRFYCSSDGVVSRADRAAIQTSLTHPPSHVPFGGILAAEHDTASGIHAPPLTDRYHGWAQPVTRDDALGGLAILRGAERVSIHEIYAKASIVLWLASDLHRAALEHACSSMGV